MTRPIFFLSDFGLADTYVGVVKAVILGIAPGATVVDLTHEIPPQDVRAGAFALLAAVRYLPDDAVVLAVVDPGVGTARRPIAVEAHGRAFVGPDNGLLSWALAGPTRGSEPTPPSTPPWRAVVLDRPGFWRPTVSATFHGRDVFGPVAAHLAAGVPRDALGTPIEAIQQIPFPTAARELDDRGQSRRVRGEVIHVDRFGNLVTCLTADDLPSRPLVAVAGHEIVGLASHFQAPTGPSGLLALIGSAGLLEIAVPNGSAAARLGAGVGAEVVVRPTGTIQV